jgi:CBS domain containing-hemolysin-like protein
VSAPVGQLVGWAVALLLVAGLLAAADAALTRLSKGRAAELADEGRRGSSSLVKVMADPARIFLVATFLRVLAESAAAVALTLAFASALPSWWTAAPAAAGSVTGAVFVLVGVGAPTLGRQHAVGIGLVAAPILLWLTRILGPLARLLVVIGNMITPGPGYRDGPFATEAELRELVDLAQESDVIEDDEREMIHSVFELGDTLTREVMVPRTSLVSVTSGAVLREAMSVFLGSGFSRVPVVGEDMDDIIGVLYLKDVARRLHEDATSPVIPAGDGPVVVDDLMRTPLFVPDSKPADDLLRQMQAEAGHVAIVVDEYGGTAGMVTLEDLVEEIVGEIADEHDTETPEFEQLGKGCFRVSSRMHIEDCGDLFDVELDDDEVDTVAGLVAKHLGRVPLAGSRVVVEGLSFTAERFEGRRHQLATVIVERWDHPGHEEQS